MLDVAIEQCVVVAFTSYAFAHHKETVLKLSSTSMPAKHGYDWCYRLHIPFDGDGNGNGNGAFHSSYIVLQSRTIFSGRVSVGASPQSVVNYH
jgi:hypothetical protein